jgi:hypothetical protein
METTNNKLSAEDLSLIEQMDVRLKYLEALLDEALEKETPESLKQWLASKRKNRTCNNNCSDVCGECQPAAKDEIGIVEPKEVVQDEENWQYAKCVSSQWVFEEGVIYPITPFTKNNPTPMVTSLDGNSRCSLTNYRMYFYPATEAEFNQQNEVVNEVEQERWQPSYGVKYWYIGSNDGQFFVAYFHWGNDDVDFVNHDTGNCFKSKEEAQEADNFIKQYLSKK